jgi:hypothetical protein
MKDWIWWWMKLHALPERNYFTHMPARALHVPTKSYMLAHFSTLILNCSGSIDFHFFLVKSRIKQVPEFVLDVPRSLYIGNQNKPLSLILNKDNVQRSN